MPTAKKPRGGKGRKKKEEEPKVGLRQKFSEILELPKEIVLNVPKITLIGNENLLIENYKGVVEYEDNRIKINTGKGIIKITGERLVIKGITSEDVMIDGEINSLEFML